MHLFTERGLHVTDIESFDLNTATAAASETRTTRHMGLAPSFASATSAATGTHPKTGIRLQRLLASMLAIGASLVELGIALQPSAQLAPHHHLRGSLYWTLGMLSTRSSPRKSSWTKHMVTRSLGGTPIKAGKPSPGHDRSHSTSMALPHDYPPTPQLNETVDTTPFSESFSALLRFSPYKDDTFVPDAKVNASPDVFQRALRHEASYVVEAVSDIRDVDSEWDDEDVVEVMVVRNSGKAKNATPTPKRPLERNFNDQFSTPTPVPPLLMPTSDNFSILRTLQHSKAAARTAYLAYAQKSAGLVIVRAYKHPVGERAQAERDTLRAISEVDVEDESPYLERLIHAWEDDQAAYLVTPHHHGGNLLQYIESQGAVSRQLLQVWGAELACGLVALQDLGMVHGAVRPSVIQLRANGHLILGGFENTVHFMRASPRPVDRETGGEWHHAPESLLGWEAGPEADWWAYGIVLAWMALGQHPFSLSATERFRGDNMKKRILAGTSSCVSLNVLDPSLRGLIEECLERNPAKRLGFLAVCEHPIFADIEWGTVLHELGDDLNVVLPPAVYPAADSPDRPVVLTPSLNGKRSQISVRPSRIALPRSPKPNDVKHRHARTLSHVTSQSTFSSAHCAVLGRATRTRLPAARPISIAVPTSPSAYSSLRTHSPPLTPSLSVSPPTTSSTISSIQTPATTPLPQLAGIKDIPSPTPSEAGLGSPALSSFIGSPLLTSSPAIYPRPSNPAPDRTLPLPLTDSPTGPDTSMLTVRASMVPKPVPAGLGLTIVDVEGRCEDVDEFGMWTAATSVDALNGHDSVQHDYGQDRDDGEEEADATGQTDTNSLRMRVRDKLRRRRREAVAVTPTKKSGRRRDSSIMLTQEDLAAIEITVPELNWYPSDGADVPRPPLLMVNGKPGQDGLEIEADPFRVSGASLVPDVSADPPTPVLDDAAFALRKNQSFRWSALSLDQTGRPPILPPAPSPARSVGGRILRGGEALLRRSQYSLRSRWNRTPSRAVAAHATPETPAMVPSPTRVASVETSMKARAVSGPEPREGEPVGLGAGVRRIGRGIGFTQKSPSSSPTSARYKMETHPGVDVWQSPLTGDDDELGVPRGCYAGFSMRRRRASARPVIEVEHAQDNNGVTAD